jgi:hypothetical protein
MKERLNIRINDIEFRYKGETRGEFICWYPNEYYGKLEEYLKNGWEERNGVVISNTPFTTSMSKTLFELKETCYVVAWLKYDEKEQVCDLTTVGDRMLRLKNISTFMEVYEIADKKMVEINREEFDA